MLSLDLGGLWGVAMSSQEGMFGMVGLTIPNKIKYI